MVEQKKKAGRFANLARQARGEEEIPEPQPAQEPLLEQENPPAKKRGRPSGRRSDPDYTQISAYIPLELLHEVQDLLLQERRRKRLRRVLMSVGWWKNSSPIGLSSSGVVNQIFAYAKF
jgi:hypothetical protein